MGKYLNAYKGGYTPPGWDTWQAQTSKSHEPLSLTEDGRGPYSRRRAPDGVIASKAVEFLHSAVAGQEPFFLWLGFNSPHAPAKYQKMYARDFADEPLPGPPNFNEADVSDKPAWIRRQSLIGRDGIDTMEHFHRKRLRSLQTADAFVEQAVSILAESGELENTYIVFTTDNGYHMGNHRLRPGKQAPYEEDVRFPLLVRGPGIPAGVVRTELAVNTDLAPTFAEWGGAPAPDPADGRSLAPLLRGENIQGRSAVLLENEGLDPLPSRRVPAYRAIRTRDALYVEYANGEREYYDLAVDPYQLENTYASLTPEESATLSARLETLKDCAGEECRTAEDGITP